eukprot:SAG22_NODE_65_length_23128_cov_51.766609_4_plen_254_part_00
MVLGGVVSQHQSTFSRFCRAMLAADQDASPFSYHGCPACSAEMPTAGNYYGAPNCNSTSVPTLPDEFATWNIPDKATGKRPSKFGDWTAFHPWRAPGRAPVADPCGVAGAYKLPVGGGGQTPIGAKQGDKGSGLPVGVVTDWKAGAVEEVGFMLGANHGGGYLYSVCPKSEPLTEKCLQGYSLHFASSNHTIRYLDGRPDLQVCVCVCAAAGGGGAEGAAAGVWGAGGAAFRAWLGTLLGCSFVPNHPPAGLA